MTSQSFSEPPKVSLTIHSGTRQLTVQALVDTSATHTVLSERVARQLGLQPTGTTAVSGPGGMIEVEQSVIDLTYKDISVPNVSVIILPEIDYNAIGLDVIANYPSILQDAYPSLSASTPLPDDVVTRVAETILKRHEEKEASQYLRNVLFGDLLVGGVVGGIVSYLLITFGSTLLVWSGTFGAALYVVVLAVLFSAVVLRKWQRTRRKRLA